MGSHLIDGQFKSDKYSWCPPGFVPLKVTDPHAQPVLWDYAKRHRGVDAEFSADLETALRAKGYEPGLPNALKQLVREKLEWWGDSPQGRRCPCCWGVRPDHKPGCTLEAALLVMTTDDDGPEIRPLAVELGAWVLQAECLTTCSSRCDEGNGPQTSDGPCGIREHFDKAGTVHLACTCGWLALYKRLRESDLVPDMLASDAPSTSTGTTGDTSARPPDGDREG